MKPIIVLSRCLNRERVRYNGGLINDEFVNKLENYIDFITVCPEVDIGMSVPRAPVILVRLNDEIRIIEPISQEDFTERMINFSKNFLSNLKEIDGFILKAKSPSCGVGDAKLYSQDFKKYIGKTNGLFANYAKEFYPYLPIEDEGRLNDYWIRQNFLTKAFAYADLRSLKNNFKKITDLIRFHQNYKYLIMLYSPNNLKKMGSLVANWEKLGLEKTFEKYEELFKDTFSKRQSIKAHINVIQHIYGHFSDFLKPKEKRHFQTLLDKLREDRIYLKVLLEFIRNFAYRFEDEYLLSQKYINPYPLDLEVF